jgi:hypothetical protein
MAKPLALLNQDMAQAYRLHSVTSPPEAFELTDLDKDLLQTLLNKNISSRQKINSFYDILNRYKSVLGQFHDANVKPSTPLPLPEISSTPLGIDKSEQTDAIEDDDDEEEEIVDGDEGKKPKITNKKKVEERVSKLIKEIDPNFGSNEKGILLTGKVVPRSTWKNLISQFAAKTARKNFTQGQEQLAGVIYGLINKHPDFQTALEHMPGFKRYVAAKLSMTTRSDESSPVKFRTQSTSALPDHPPAKKRNIEKIASGEETDEDETAYEAAPDVFLSPSPKKGKGISKQKRAGWVHIKRWEKHMKK